MPVGLREPPLDFRQDRTFGPERRAARNRAAALVALAFGCAAMALGATSYKQPGFSETVVFKRPDQPHGRTLPARRPRLRRREERPHQGLPRHHDQHVYRRSPTCALRSTTSGTAACSAWRWTPTSRPTPYVYVLYTFDAPIGGTAPRWGPGGGTTDGCPTRPGPTTDGCVVSGRLSRLTAVGRPWPASEHVLIEDWCQQFPSHSIGDPGLRPRRLPLRQRRRRRELQHRRLRAVRRTSGSSPTPKNPCGDPPGGRRRQQTPPTAEGGSLRSQSPRTCDRRAARPERLDPPRRPGHRAGVPDNPFFASSRRERAAHHRVRPAQPLPLHHPTRDQRALDRRRRLERLGGDRSHRPT